MTSIPYHDAAKGAIRVRALRLLFLAAVLAPPSASGADDRALSRGNVPEPYGEEMPIPKVVGERSASEVRRGAAEKRFHQMSEVEIGRALRRIHQETPDLQGRIVRISGLFLGTPYRPGPLGEGPWGEFDRDPLINFKEADCTTLIEQVMALALESDLSRAGKTLRKIRYKDGKIKYEARNHFTSADWAPNNISAGYLKDITRDVAGSDAQTASKTIRKRAWYEAKTAKDLAGFKDASPAEQDDRVRRWHELGRRFSDREIHMDYLPMADLPRLMSRIPSGTIANLVREDREDMPDVVSHQVLVIDQGGEKMIRHASSSGAVEDAPMLNYFFRYFKSKWRLLGLNLDQLQDPRNKRRQP